MLLTQWRNIVRRKFKSWAVVEAKETNILQILYRNITIKAKQPGGKTVKGSSATLDKEAGLNGFTLNFL